MERVREQILAVQRMQDYIAENLEQEITLAVEAAMEGYDPAVIGYVWDDSNPRIQLEPRGERGYIELRPVKKN